MPYLDTVLTSLSSVDNSSLSLSLPVTLAESEVDFKEDGVVIEGHIASRSKDGKNISFVGDDEDIWVIRTEDIIDSDEMAEPLENVPGTPVKLKVRSNAVILLERRMKVGKNIIGSSNMNPTSEELAAAASGPPKGCKCPKGCKRGYCCAQGGWVMKCQRSSCVSTRVRCG